MLPLAACAEPSLHLPVEVPVAESATRMPASSFVGPREPWRASDAELCAEPPDHEKLLRSGAFGWRVTVLRGGEAWLPLHGILRRADPREGDAEHSRIQNALRWFAIRCHREHPDRSLLVVDGPTSVVPPGFFPSHVLVRDPTPGSPVAPPTPAEDPSWASVIPIDGGWVALPGDDAHADALHAQLPAEAARFLSARRTARVLVHVDPHQSWAQLIAAQDALTAVGIRTAWTLPPTGDTGRTPPAPTARHSLGLGDDIDVLVRHRWTGGPVVLQMISVSGPTSGDAVAEVLGDEGAAMAGLDNRLDGTR